MSHALVGLLYHAAGSCLRVWAIQLGFDELPK